jgi:predicted membrane metal-binding protein
VRLPPLVARVRIRTRGRAYRLWVPLFLVWLLLALLLAPVLLVALLLTLLVARRWRFLPLAGGLYTALCEARGTRVELEGERATVFVALH